MRFYKESSFTPAKFLTAVHEIIAKINDQENIYIYVDDKNYGGVCRLCVDSILTPNQIKQLRDLILSDLKERGISAKFGDYEDVCTLGDLDIEPSDKV